MKEKRDNLAGGLILISIGLIALLSQFELFSDFGNFATFFMAGLGGLFLVWGILTRQAGLIIPGGIISGIGWGIVLITGPLLQLDGSDAEGAVFMLTFAAGWAAITILTAVFTDETHWWALIPGGIMALIGGSLIFGGVLMTILEWVGKGWPLVLILLGVYILFNSNKNKEKSI